MIAMPFVIIIALLGFLMGYVIGFHEAWTKLHHFTKHITDQVGDMLDGRHHLDDD